MSDAEETAVIEVTVGAPVEAVWATLRDPELIKLWHGWHYGEAGLEEEIQLIFFTGATVDEEAHELRLGDGDRFSLAEVPEGTRVRIVRGPYVPGEEWSAYYGEITEGWLSFLQQLRFLHERHPGEQRRTLAFMGQGPAAALPRLRAVVPATIGETWYAAEHQRGVLLPELGPGLLITATKPPGEDGGVGTMALLTTYGLDDAAFEAVRQRWTAWWRSGYPDAEDAQI
jgi:hypothetical protein